MKCLRDTWAFRKSIIMVATPVLLSFIPVAWPSQEAYCGFIMAWMAVYWMLEIFPIAITAMMPLVLFPVFGILTGEEVAKNYCKDTQMLFIGGLTVAVAVEHVNLHRRIALKVLMFVGSKPRWLMFGFMMVTFLLSMWISNTATTAMMVPIVAAVLEQLMSASTQDHEMENVEKSSPNGNCMALGKHPSTVSTVALISQSSKVSLNSDAKIGCTEAPLPVKDNSATTSNGTPTEAVFSLAEDEEGATDQYSNYIKQELPSQPDNPEQADKKYDIGLKIKSGTTQGIDNTTMCKGMLLCVCYAANIGGSSTLTGTGTNVVLAGQLSVLYESPEAQVSYSQWMMFALPNAIACALAGWVWLQFYFFGKETLCSCFLHKTQATVRDDKAHQIIRHQYHQLGSIKFKEIVVFCNFLLLVTLWIFREPNFFPGWGAIFKTEYVTDATAAIFVVLLLFVWPSEKPDVACCIESADGGKRKPTAPIMLWETIHHKLPWNVVLLMGGGYALADGVQKSGLSRLISEQLTVLDVLPPWILLLVLSLIIASLTEVASNAATASIFIPILADLAEALCIHPYYFIYTAAIACSFAFMLPVATPPNAIVFSYGALKIPDMAKAGIVMNISSLLILSLFINTYGFYVFGFREFPEWAVLNPSNHSCY